VTAVPYPAFAKAGGWGYGDTSLLRFIEDNWLDGQHIGQGSFDSIANPIDGMFDFRKGPRTTR
jgi:hypothetical protein